MARRYNALFAAGCLLLLALVIIGCSTGDLAGILGGGGGFHPVAHTPKFAIVSDFSGPSLHSFAVDPSTGALTEVAGSPIKTTISEPWATVVTPDGAHAYVGDQASGTVERFSINTSTGAIASLGTTSTANPGGIPWFDSIGITPLGTVQAQSDEVQLNAFIINPSTGDLTPAPGSPYTTGGGAFSVAVDPQGRYIFVFDSKDRKIYGFSVNSSTGALTPTGTPVASGLVDPHEGLTVDGLGNFLYVAGRSDNAVAGFKIGSNGTLTSIGAPFPTGTDPIGVVADPLGGFVYTDNFSPGTVTAFAVNPTTGALTPVPGSNPFALTDASPNGMTVDPSGKFLYGAACAGGSQIDAASINSSTGGLSNVSGQPFGSAVCDGGIAITH